MRAKNIPKKAISGIRILRKEGLDFFLIKIVEKLRRRGGKKHKVNFLVNSRDVELADWSGKRSSMVKPSPGKNKRLVINWVMSPPGKGSGGHQNLFRFIRYMEKAGHLSQIYLYSTRDKRSLREIHEVLDHSYPKIKAPIEWLGEEMKQADALFATGWETAYPVFNVKLSLTKFYFVQDFEPYFYPVGSEYVLAENTYRFGFYGVTAGGWLAKKLHDDYGMATDYFEFGADKTLYSLANRQARKEVFFYARPVTARRGFEIGLMALELFHRKNPDYVINLAGWDVSDYEIPFPYVNLMSLPLNKLAAVYNRCAVALVISLTNMSLLPLELLACGTIPVMNDGENNRLVSNNSFIAFTPNSPVALAEKMSELVNDPTLPQRSAEAAKSVDGNSWDESGAKFVKIVEDRLRG